MTLPERALATQGRIDGPQGTTIDVRYSDSTTPYLHAIRLTHPDRDISGRRWITEIGLSAEDGGATIAMTIVLHTEDITSNALGAVHLTRPRVVQMLMEQHRLATLAPAQSVQHLNATTHAEFVALVQDPQRFYPLVVLSSRPDGTTTIDSERLARLAGGIASVWQLDPQIDFRLFGADIDAGLVPKFGAARILGRTVQGSVPVRFLHPTDIDDWRLAGDATQSCFEAVAAKALRYALDQHVTLEQVSEERVRRRFARERARVDAANPSVPLHLMADVQERAAALEHELRQAREDMRILESMVEERERVLAIRADERDMAEAMASDEAARRFRAEATADALRAALEQRADGSIAPSLDAEETASMVRMLQGSGTVEDALRAVASLYRDRVIVLDSAWRSARESEEFQKVDKASELLLQLAGPYWEALASGKPDAVARQVFGSAFASTESERVATNGGARKRRTFVFLGQALAMLPHLKIGRKDSVAETLRIHFEWVAEHQTIVIGHCGPHLNFN
jgi:hypothetical protein